MESKTFNPKSCGWKNSWSKHNLPPSPPLKKKSLQMFNSQKISISNLLKSFSEQNFLSQNFLSWATFGHINVMVEKELYLKKYCFENCDFKNLRLNIEFMVAEIFYHKICLFRFFAAWVRSVTGRILTNFGGGIIVRGTNGPWTHEYERQGPAPQHGPGPLVPVFPALCAGRVPVRP